VRKISHVRCMGYFLRSFIKLGAKKAMKRANSVIKATQRMRLAISIGLGAWYVFMIPPSLASAQAAAQEAAKPVSQMKEVQGEVSFVASNFISVIYKRDAKAEYEMAFPFDKKKILLDHVQSVNQINIGDTVSIQYEETVQQAEKGAKISRSAKKIFFIRPTNRPKEVIDIGFTQDPLEQAAQE
jgi:hypothetical protein